MCDLESILTCHRRSLGSKGCYTRGNGWLDIIAPLISLKQPRDQTCGLFQVRSFYSYSKYCNMLLLSNKLMLNSTLSLIIFILLLQAVVNRYIPSNSNAFHLFRLLLLYHDPQLCSFLDTKRITPEKYAAPWVRFV